MRAPLSPARGPRIVLAAAVAALAATTMAACSSSGTSPSASATQAGAAKAQDCLALSGVLSDGPDPDSDAVGYAQAQVLPLQKLTVGDPAVRSAVSQLDAAFQAFSADDGSAQSQNAAKVASAEDALNKLCPGVAP